jgi:hypothetical protein
MAWVVALFVSVFAVALGHGGRKAALGSVGLSLIGIFLLFSR